MSFIPNYNPTTSAFNEGMFQIQRLHNLWSQVNYHSKHGDFKNWRWTLDIIWRELSRDAIRITDKKFNPTEFDQLQDSNPWFKQWGTLTKAAANAKEREDIYLRLNDMEIFLRSLQDKAGKGGKYKDPGEGQMD